MRVVSDILYYDGYFVVFYHALETDTINLVCPASHGDHGVEPSPFPAAANKDPIDQQSAMIVGNAEKHTKDILNSKDVNNRGYFF